MSIPAYRDPAKSVEERVADLLPRLSTAEKAGQLTQYFYLGSGSNDQLADFDIESLPAEHRAAADQPRKVLAALAAGRLGAALFVTDPVVSNELQRVAVEESPHGIPLLLGFDVIHGMRTIFPVPIALAASWDPELIEQAQAVAAREARALGIHWTFAPMIDVARDARWGRIIEGAGEDPVLGAAVAAAHVRGFQGDGGPASIIAGPKHFVGYGASRGGRDYDDVELSESELHNVYLPPFLSAINAGAGNIMAAYMELNGVPAAANRRMLTDVLRGQLGFDGWVVSDANGVISLQTQQFAADHTDAAVRALTAGLDMEMAMFSAAFDHLPDAVADGRVDEAVLDKAVSRILAAKFRLGLFERPYVEVDDVTAVLGAPSHRELAAAAAERSIVLLKNSGSLPLDASAITTVAVIGEFADSKRDTLGPWVFAHDLAETVTILDGIRSRLGTDVDVIHEPGATAPGRVFASPFDLMDPTVAAVSNPVDEPAAIDAAVAAAEGADVAIVVVGQRQNQIGEKASVSTLDLPGRQLEQLQRIVATGTPVVLIVMSGRPLDLRWPQDNVAAIIQAWYPGTRGGDAVAAVLVGDISPAARLPFTWPRHVGQLPAIYSHHRTFNPEDTHARYFDGSNAPLYPFGFGLGYATFEYTNLRLEHPIIRVGESVTVSVDVTNTSTRDGDDVVQLYIHQRYGGASRPVRELKAFARIAVPAGATIPAQFTLGPDDLRYWSDATHDWVQEATTFDIWVGGDSTARLATELTVTA
uniref:Exo-alpha-(1->6)-L-arabinopyranosidase n=1 Tax=Pseudonocardia sp. Gsoil1536 TaxID=1271883 RepID=L0EKA9_9PSEU|nr:glycoside hydrolase [Pseudonocardia sp. Gsoil1536]